MGRCVERAQSNSSDSRRLMEGLWADFWPLPCLPWEQVSGRSSVVWNQLGKKNNELLMIFLDFKNGCTCIGLETQEKWIPIIFYKSLTSDLLSILTFTCLYKGVENEEWNASFDPAGGQGTRLENSLKALPNRQCNSVGATVSLTLLFLTVQTLESIMLVWLRNTNLLLWITISEMVLAGDWMVSIQVSLFYNLIQPAKETVGLKGLVTLSTKTLTTSTVLIQSMFWFFLVTTSTRWTTMICFSPTRITMPVWR